MSDLYYLFITVEYILFYNYKLMLYSIKREYNMTLNTKVSLLFSECCNYLKFLQCWMSDLFYLSITVEYISLSYFILSHCLIVGNIYFLKIAVGAKIERKSF